MVSCRSCRTYLGGKDIPKTRESRAETLCQAQLPPHSRHYSFPPPHSPDYSMDVVLSSYAVVWNRIIIDNYHYSKSFLRFINLGLFGGSSLDRSSIEKSWINFISSLIFALGKRYLSSIQLSTA